MEKAWQVIGILQLLMLCSCIKSSEKEITLPLPVDKDAAYTQSYNKATASYEIINNFETRFTVKTTLLSSQFRQAFAGRYQSLYNESAPVLTEASQKTGFFVSVYAANEQLNDISDVNLWTIQLIKGNETLRPSKVQRLRDKDRWRPFFTDITPWSHEFLVIFDTPAPITGDQDLVYTKESRLVLSNQDGRVTITW